MTPKSRQDRQRDETSKPRWRRRLATVTHWFKQPDDACRTLWRCLLVILFVEGIGVLVLAAGEFYLATTPFGHLGAGILLAIGIANLWAFDSVRRGAATWAREAVIAQVLALILAGYVIFIDWRSPGISRPVMAVAGTVGVVALLWIIVLADRARVKWTKTAAIVAALFPLAALLQFWLQTYYIPQTSRPVVDISPELSEQGRTEQTIYLSAKVTLSIIAVPCRLT
jgi:hypothetical protein